MVEVSLYTVNNSINLRNRTLFFNSKLQSVIVCLLFVKMCGKLTRMKINSTIGKIKIMSENIFFMFPFYCATQCRIMCVCIFELVEILQTLCSMGGFFQLFAWSVCVCLSPLLFRGHIYRSPLSNLLKDFIFARVLFFIIRISHVCSHLFLCTAYALIIATPNQTWLSSVSLSGVWEKPIQCTVHIHSHEISENKRVNRIERIRLKQKYSEQRTRTTTRDENWSHESVLPVNFVVLDILDCICAFNLFYKRFGRSEKKGILHLISIAAIMTTTATNRNGTETNSTIHKKSTWKTRPGQELHWNGLMIDSFEMQILQFTIYMFHTPYAADEKKRRGAKKKEIEDWSKKEYRNIIHCQTIINLFLLVNMCVCVTYCVLEWKVIFMAYWEETIDNFPYWQAKWEKKKKTTTT